MDEQMPKVTYLFGAGASANTLPTIKGLPGRIKVVRDFIQENYRYKEGDVLQVTKEIAVNKNEAKNYVILGLDKLIEVSSDHSTIDTYAKKLYINGKHKHLTEMSFFLSLYFNIEQKISGVDPRYDTFLISLLDRDLYRFPKNLKFLTWNYDLQMEAAHARLSDQASDKPSFSLFNTEELNEKEDFTSIKINGQCSFKNRQRSITALIENVLVPECSEGDLDFMLGFSYLHLCKGLNVYSGNVKLNFAWYHDISLLNKIAEHYNETDTLVVIGYSFPFFNRNVDRKIIRSMSNLSKIYIQDMEPENIKSKFLSILPDWEMKNIEIIPVTDVSEFFLPPEL